ncbi:GNAT family N-acetyltransferase [Acidobacteria bacterium AB60]|nr:GNAT family N-acetyltransferase [Acidobacteria bacterium AB60]
MHTHVCNPVVRLANTAVLRDTAFHLRYQVYIEEKGWTNSHADHRNRTLSEPLDETGKIWVALCNGRCIGTLRSNLFSECYAASYGILYDLESLNEDGTAALLTNFAVDSSHRNLRTAMTLVRATFGEGIRQGVQTALLDCEPQLVPFYRWLGFEVHKDHVAHPEYGPGVCMKMNVERWTERFHAAYLTHVRKLGSNLGSFAGEYRGERRVEHAEQS